MKVFKFDQAGKRVRVNLSKAEEAEYADILNPAKPPESRERRAMRAIIAALPQGQRAAITDILDGKAGG